MTVRKTVTELVTDQHAHIGKLLDEVVETAGQARQNAFDELRRMLVVHETAEEVVIHPVTERIDPEMVQARLSEENQLKLVLAELEELDVNDATFVDTFGVLRRAVQEHTQAEERLELPLLETAGDDVDQLRMADAMRRVEDLVPTHPHPGVGESPAGQLIGAPLAALADKTRDVIGSVLRG